MKQFASNKGFSLVELMSVVAIIGILAIIGIPHYQKVQSKARHAEAKALLNALYMGQIAFNTEYGSYSGNLATMGVGTTGNNLRYNGGFTSATCAGENPTAPPTADTNNDVISVTTAGANWYWVTMGDVVADSAHPSITCTGAAFEAGAWGNPTHTLDAGNNNRDVFTINNNKELKQRSVGI